MSISIYGAFRTNTSMSANTATYATIGSTFQINSYSKISITDGGDPSIITGDNVTNETPNDPSQTYNGEVIIWDYTIQVTDGSNTYEVGVMDWDINGNGTYQWPTGEQGYFIAFLNGDIPPVNTTLTVVAVTDNGPSIPVSSVVPCFVAGTLIDTPSGPQKIEKLRAGDDVLTLDNGPKRIRWIGARTLSIREIVLKPKLKPIRIKAGALGANLPLRDLCVSPQHRVLVRSPIAKRMFGGEEALIPAHKLVDIPGIFTDTVDGPVTYMHLLLDSHEIVFSEGAPTESLFTGKEALKSVGDDAYDEIISLFPQLAASDYLPAMARFCPPKGKHMKTLVRRHVSNQKPLLAVQ
ncbi:Hint domain-containing protein [Aliiroseovarius sp. S1339]|uniref:Hint domain-containing protein n=1 Tax=Aliiroseovarius sp. S1339 TaxID=2936990 RepID=UPI0020C00BF5|nr:Hint domain-containing protein [Aliiroseovarius sp. S1339]MCK8464889.1 Hint domain-containing protein [Aliiroseovarius sp. S1339]